MSKQRIEIVASEETYVELSSFQDINHLNDTVRSYKERFQGLLSKTAIKVLDLLHRYSAKYKGVSFLYKNTIAETLEISRRTVIRICKLLESFGIIKQFEMKRKSDMRQTGNAIVIQPLEIEKQEIVTQEEQDLSHHEDNISLKQIHIKDSKERTANADRKPNWIPVKFFNLLKYHMDTHEIEEFWRAAYAVTYRLEISSEEKTEMAIEAFMTLKSKRKNLEKPIAFFVGILKKKSRAVHVKNLFHAIFS